MSLSVPSPPTPRHDEECLHHLGSVRHRWTIGTPLPRHHPPTVAAWDVASAVPSAVRPAPRNSGWSPARTARSGDPEPEAWHLRGEAHANRLVSEGSRPWAQPPP